jgi:predicted transcriptional regulator of viral defense system
MAYLEEPYYVGVLSAAAYHGAAHQAIQVFQVIVRKNRKPLSCGKVRVEFIAKLDMEQAPTQTVNTPRSLIRISTLEMTAFDLVGYYHRCGGLDHVATILKELGEKLGPQKLLQASESVPLPWVQRLAYLLTLVGFESKTRLLQKFIASQDAPVTPLLPGTPMSGSEKDRKFRVAINTEVEPDQRSLLHL